jgi:hypothetical protein
MKGIRAVIAVFACMMLMPGTAAGESNSSHLNKERLKVGRALLEVTSENVGSILPYYTDDIEYHDPIVDVYGIGEMSEFLYRLFGPGATPDLITSVEEEIAIDGYYMASWTMVGTFAGVPYEAKGMSIMKFRKKSTQVYYQRDYYSEGDIMIAIPPLAPAVCGFREFYKAAVDPLPAPPDLRCPPLQAPPGSP